MLKVAAICITEAWNNTQRQHTFFTGFPVASLYPIIKPNASLYHSHVNGAFSLRACELVHPNCLLSPV